MGGYAEEGAALLVPRTPSPIVQISVVEKCDHGWQTQFIEGV